MKVNEYLLFNVSWKETNPNLSDICKFFFMLPQAMNNSDIECVNNMFNNIHC